MIVFILLFVALIVVGLIIYFRYYDGYLSYYFLPKHKGDYGEWLVSNYIGDTDELNSYYVINDITLMIDGVYAQIDHIVICRSGIYVIETKNYDGYIFANEYDKEWIQTIHGRRYYFYSPYLQNLTHCKRITEILGIYEHIFNVIVFVRNNVDKRYCKHIYYLEELEDIKYNDYINLTAEQCKEYYDKILSYEI